MFISIPASKEIKPLVILYDTYRSTSYTDNSQLKYEGKIYKYDNNIFILGENAIKINLNTNRKYFYNSWTSNMKLFNFYKEYIIVSEESNDCYVEPFEKKIKLPKLDNSFEFEILEKMIKLYALSPNNKIEIPIYGNKILKNLSYGITGYKKNSIKADRGYYNFSYTNEFGVKYNIYPWNYRTEIFHYLSKTQKNQVRIALLCLRIFFPKGLKYIRAIICKIAFSI